MAEPLHPSAACLTKNYDIFLNELLQQGDHKKRNKTNYDLCQKPEEARR
jgi:hypothetical protein